MHSIIRPGQVILQVVTKADKLNQKEKSALMKAIPNVIMISNTKKSGIDKLVNIVHNLLFKEEDID